MEDAILLWVLLALLVLAIVAIVWLAMRHRRSRHLREHFGPEFAETLRRTDDPAKAEAELLEREKRVKKFDIRPLSADQTSRFQARWHKVQELFVDHPRDAVMRADELLGELMETKGYPVSDFEQRSNDLSVEHPLVVRHYRAGHEIALRHERGEAGTEDLRQALIHYRELFEEMVTGGTQGGRLDQYEKRIGQG